MLREERKESTVVCAINMDKENKQHYLYVGLSRQVPEIDIIFGSENGLTHYLNTWSGLWIKTIYAEFLTDNILWHYTMKHCPIFISKVIVKICI